MSNKFVSVIIPVRNEERYIKQCLDAVNDQTYNHNNMEVMIIDGLSTDRTKEIFLEYKKTHNKLDLIWLDNTGITAPKAMNIGIKNAKGEIIIRLDAHSSYEREYIEKCVYFLKKTGAANVGGIAETQGRDNYVGRVIALLLSSKFGVGNSSFRTNGKSGYVDTVPFGAYRRDIFDKVGLYDERLTRNQDIELNYRIRRYGEKIYLSSDIHLTYYCRDSLSELCKMGYKNGLWNIITQKLCPGSLRMRHFIPLIFTLSLFFGWGAILFEINILKEMFICELFVYLLLMIVFTIQKISVKNIKYIPLLPFLFPIFHISYGLGSFVGLIRRY